MDKKRMKTNKMAYFDYTASMRNQTLQFMSWKAKSCVKEEKDVD